MVILNTNIIIDHLRQSGDDASYLMKVLKKEGKRSLFISTISIQELFEGKSTSHKEKLRLMLSVLAPLSVLDYDIKIAELAGEIARDLNRPLGFADSAIAATCIFNKGNLLTINKKHFENIPELFIYDLNSL